MRSGSIPSMRRPSKTISPRVTWPSSDLSRPEMAFSVVDLPAPLAPSSVTTAPCGTSRLKPRRTRMTSSYMTSTLRTASSGAAPAAGTAPMWFGCKVIHAPRIHIFRPHPEEVASAAVSKDGAAPALPFETPPSAAPQGEEQGRKPGRECLSPAAPLGLARQVDGRHLLELDRAVLDEIAERRIRRTGHLGAIEAHRQRRTVVGFAPGRRIAHALHARRHPVLLLIEALLHVGPGDAAVLAGPIHGFLEIHGGADRGHVVHGSIRRAGGVGDFRDLHQRFHAGRITAPDDGRAQWKHDAIGSLAGGFGGVLVHPPDVAEELHLGSDVLAGLEHRDVGAGGVAEIGVV